MMAGPRVNEVDSVFKVSSRINSTFGGNLVDMVRCQRYLEIIEEEKLVDNAAKVGEFLLEGLQNLVIIVVAGGQHGRRRPHDATIVEGTVFGTVGGVQPSRFGTFSGLLLGFRRERGNSSIGRIHNE